MNIALSYKLPRTRQKTTQQVNATQQVDLSDQGTLDFLGLVETGRLVVVQPENVLLTVEYLATPTFTELFTDAASQQGAVEQLWTSRLSLLLRNFAQQDAIVFS